MAEVTGAESLRPRPSCPRCNRYDGVRFKCFIADEYGGTEHPIREYWCAFCEMLFHLED